MNTSNIYEAAFYLSSEFNELTDIEIIGESVYYHVDGDNMNAMKKKYRQNQNANVNFHAFTSALLRLQNATQKALIRTKQGIAPGRSKS
jgi:hypothetical protein